MVLRYTLAAAVGCLLTHSDKVADTYATLLGGIGGRQLVILGHLTPYRRSTDRTF